MEADIDVTEYRPRPRRVARSQPEQLARGLGWVSVGVGIAQILAPRAMSRLVGLPLPRALTVACGLRDLMCGIGMLSQREPLPWLHARVAGDAIDLAAFGGAMMMPGAARGRLAAGAALTAGLGAFDIYCTRALAKDARRPAPRHDKMSVEVMKTPQELYRFCRTLDNLAPLLPNLESVRVLDGLRSHWVTRGPDRVEWDCEIIDDVPGERLAWRAVDGSAVYSAGSVQFVGMPSGGTLVRLELLYERPRASLASAVIQLFGIDPARRTAADAQVLKRLLEAAV